MNPRVATDAGITSLDGVLDRLTGLWQTGIVRAAVELHVAEHLVAGADTAEAIAAAEGADARSLAVLMDALCGLGFLEKTDGRYGLEPFVALLVPAISEFGGLSLDDATWAAWGGLSKTIRSGKPPLADSDYWVRFAHASREVALQQGMLAREFVPTEPGFGTRILDVGCGSGGVGYAFALADPTATVVGLDDESVLEIAAARAEELGLTNRVELRRVDLATVDLGAGEYDLVILSNMLHLLDPGSNRSLLARTHAALASEGRVLIVEIVPDDDRRQAEYALMFAVEMLLRTPGGTTYSLPEISAWLAAAGFDRIEHHPLFGHTTAIVAVKP